MQDRVSNRTRCISHLAISLILVLCVLSSNGYAFDYWITTNQSLHACPVAANSSSSCQTLTDLLVLTNTSKLSTSNTSIDIRFLSGKHTPYQSGWINANKITNLSLTGNPNDPPIIECTQEHKIGFLLDDIKNLTIRYLIIRECGYDSTNTPSHSLKENKFAADSNKLNVHATLFLFNIEDMLLLNTLVLNNSGFGLVMIEPSKRVSIGHAQFSANFHSKNRNKGNILIISNSYLTIRIKNTTVSNGSSSSHPLFWSGVSRERYLSGGITIWHTGGQTTYVSMENLIVENNNAHKGGGLYMTTLGSYDTNCQGDLIVHIKSCTFRNNQANTVGGAIHRDYEFGSDCLDLDLYSKDAHSSIHISKSHFIGNTAQTNGGGLHIETKAFTRSFQSQVNAYTVNIIDTQFRHNRAILGGAVYFVLQTESLSYAELVPIADDRNLLTNVFYTVNEGIFEHNEALKSGGAIFMMSNEITDASLVNIITHFSDNMFSHNSASEGSVITLHSLKVNNSGLSITLGNCIFTDNYCIETATTSSLSVIHLSEVKWILLDNITIEHNSNCRGIYSNMTLIEIKGRVSIRNHTSTRGAGLYFDCKSLSTTHRTSQLLLYHSNSSLIIQDNHASLYGGGIAVRAGCSDPELCFFRGRGNQSLLSSENISVLMEHNTAGVGANSIYGGYLEYCVIENETLEFQTFDSIFEISETNEPSVVSSQPYKVCICNSSNHNCELEYNITTFPGQTFQVPVIGVSDFNNSFPSIVRATLEDFSDNRAALQDIQLTQQVGLECKKLPYTVSTDLENQDMVMSLKIDDAFSAGTIVTNFIESKIYVQIKHCPLGFELDAIIQRCLCTSYLKTVGVNCNIENVAIRKSFSSMWLGNYSNEIVAHSNCPLDFCKPNYLN